MKGTSQHASVELIFRQAATIDRTLTIRPPLLSPLARRQLRSIPFSRSTLFQSMSAGEPVLFDGLETTVRGQPAPTPADGVIHALESSFSPRDKFRVRCGARGDVRLISVQELLRRWKSGRARVSVTDLHIRGTKACRRIDCSRLSDFNLFPGSAAAVAQQEMLTMVVSSAGTFSDSHTDDPDGSNHCFVGRKLWLVWDTFAGLSRGLEDVERCLVEADQAAFSIKAFLAVPKSRWFVVEPGKTLFLPGHLTHKVVTLEPYLGVGSFFVMLPSYLRTLERWTRHTPLWALESPPQRRLDLVDRITSIVTRKVQRLANAPADEQQRWGLPDLRAAMARWKQKPLAARTVLMENPVSAYLLRTLNEI